MQDIWRTGLAALVCRVKMAAACSPPWHRIGDSPDGDSAGNPSGSKLGPTDATPERPSSRNTSSPEDSCAICLGAPENKSFTDSCFHQFCFACLAEWAKVKAECPLCKQRFKSIIHSVRSLEDYDQYFVSDLQRAPAYSMQVVYERRFRFATTMTAERRQVLEAMRLRQERERQTRHSSATHRNRNRYLPRGATTSADRFQLYASDLWAVPSMSQYREASPEFYRENPACTHRLVPWLNRELNALMQQNRSRIVAAMDHVMSLILNLDIRHLDFAQNMEPFLREHTEHFVHEFFLFATSVHDMAAYDQHTAYSSRPEACSRVDPVNWFRRSLRESERAAALELRAAPVAERHDSPQPGPSGLAVAREVVVATTVDSDSDSDSSDCIVVEMVKPLGERTPIVINLVSSDEDDASARGSHQAGLCDQEAGPSHSSCPLEDRKPFERHATSDRSSSDSDDGHARSRHSQARTRKHSKPARYRGRTPDSHGSSSRSGQRHQREVLCAAGTRRGSNSRSSTSSNEDSQSSARQRQRRKLVSVVGAVNIASKPRETSHHERHHSHHHRHEHRSRKKSTKKHKHRRHRSSHDF
ncbi:E3 ubiquitin-protein ligase Topors-like isoform X2 [Dermacentor albipictus]|uniref:E3 ubiquitin-protein ligase Topors-like isoform X2 n=1 Tax=Dermacentor albipictus TaxID=60249 RepID=UPI0031FD20FF